MDWIGQDIGDLEEHPFASHIDTGALRDEFGKQMNSLVEPLDFEDDYVIDELRAMLSEMMGGEVDEAEVSDEELKKVAQNPAYMEELIKKLHMQMWEEELEDENPFDFTNDEVDDDPFGNQQQRQAAPEFANSNVELDNLFKSSQLNKMYKRLASALHPDKVTDEQQKSERHELMQVLAEAKQSNDAFTILSLYQQHIKGAEFEFDDNTVAALETLLENKLYDLQEEFAGIDNQPGIEAMVFSRFHARTKKATQQNLQTYIANLKFDTAELKEFASEFKTVKALASVLSNRRRRAKQFPFFQLDEAELDAFAEAMFRER
ncbi:hypothetical protein C2869_19645 [Saccharobesus litoralis]|uniref:J domain-containing protein n=1 Tax=Saccharobesus litoralis TaxID=2172099 RepID=A0A2S0VW92_9ALTE|nr:hypothetical protein [Saccharobesus litoralis]AWB68478.1 hypothetical protein C2869_19645 [Saccharobesus litoralis]